MADTQLELPSDWDPRKHQRKLWSYMNGGGKRAVAVWHRRAGKDSTALNWTAVAAHQRVGTYWHLLPEAAQARKAVWEAMDKQGRRVIDQVFPKALRSSTRNDEMSIRLKNGSMWQLAGSDNYDSLVGSNPVGVVFSEFSIANPAAWEYIRPILMENGGWAIFIYTPRGRNHGYKLFETARKNPGWFSELLTVDDTFLITPEQLQQERDDGMDDDMIAQEFFCSWEGSRVGAIFGKQIAAARSSGRITSLPYDRRFPVNTFWDIGHGDATAIWFHQLVGAQDRFIKSYSASGEDVTHYVAYLQAQGYVYGRHFLPHDAKNITLASASNPKGANVWDQLKGLGIAENDLVKVDRTPDLWVGINATRSRFETAWFDEAGCEKGLDALTSYHKKWDEVRQCYADAPVKDWSSHYADAFRQWAQAYTPTAGTMTFTRAPAIAPARMTQPTMITVGSTRAGY